MRRCRYAGQAKTHLQHLAPAAALNVLRIQSTYTRPLRFFFKVSIVSS